MRFAQGLAVVATAILLAGCVLPGGKAPAKAPGANPITGAAVETTTLDGPKGQPAAPAAGSPAPGKVIGKDPAPAAKPAKGRAPSPLLEPPPSGFVDASEDAIAAAEAVKTPAQAPETTETATDPASADPFAKSETEETHVPSSPEEAKCLKSGGVWATAGKGSAMACVKPTRDAGKACTKQSQCEGFCLARSGTCAPITPMFGCNDILQDDGRRVTLCLD